MPIYELGDLKPNIHPEAWVSPEATVIGAVTLHARASVWPGAVLRADNEPIEIGEGSNVQECAVIHVDPGCPVKVGKNVTIGHQAMVHGCTIEDGVLIGIQAIVLDKTTIRTGSLVGAGAVVTGGKDFPPRSLILGSPAKVAKDLGDLEVERIQKAALVYAERQARFKHLLKRVG